MGHSTAPHETPEFNKYRLREPISESFLGTRYRAVSNTPGSVRAASAAFGSEVSSLRSSAYALRLLRAQSAAHIERVARAAKAVRYLDHPNVLAPIQLIRAQTRLGVITQDVDGFTLSEVLRLASVRGEALPQAIALRITLDLLDGLEALHAMERGSGRFTYACGGLTPDSVHVGKDGRTRFIDPGVAGAAAGVAYWGHDPVALAYTAPEQSGAEPSFNPCSDAFSAGVMIWEMLAGRSLFGAPTAAETLERLHKGPIPRVQRQHFVRGEPIAATVAHVVAQALQRDPELRHLNCADLASQLREAGKVATHGEVATHCHRLSGTSAGVFENSPRPRNLAGGSVFELSTGTIARTPPPLGVLSAQAPEPPAEPEAPEVQEELFEPQTARFQTPDLPPPPPALVPPPPAGPITAFPISDLIRTQPATQRRTYAPVAIAAAALLGLSYVVWSSTSGRSGASPPTAAAARPGVTVTTISTEPPRVPVSNTAVGTLPVSTVAPPEGVRAMVTVVPDTASPSPTGALPPDAARESGLQPAAAGAKSVDPGAKRRIRTDKVEAKPAAEPPLEHVPAGTFIPDDL